MSSKDKSKSKEAKVDKKGPKKEEKK